MTPFLFSCEHATCAVPSAHREAALGMEDRITSADGWDLGALNLAQGFSMKFRTPLVQTEYSRLLIDCHCLADDPARWSDLEPQFTTLQRERLQDKHLLAHANALRQRISSELERHESVVHVSVHTFDPIVFPNVDVSVLFSEGKISESTVGLAWLANMQELAPALRVKGNEKFYPERSKTVLDGLRDEFGSLAYIGLELQVNHQLFLAPKLMKWDKLKQLLQESLLRAVT